MGPIGDLLQRNVVRNVVGDARELFSVAPKDTVGAALKKFATSGVHGMIVVSEDNKCLGVLELMDVLQHLLHVEFRQHVFAQEAVDKVMNRNRKIFEVSPDTDLHAVVTQFAEGENRALVKDDNHVVNIISNIDIVRFIMQNYLMAQEPLNYTIEQLCAQQNIKCNIIKVSPDTTVGKVFEQMVVNGSSIVGIVDRNDKLIGSLSIADVEIFGIVREERVSGLLQANHYSCTCAGADR